MAREDASHAGRAGSRASGVCGRRSQRHAGDSGAPNNAPTSQLVRCAFLTLFDSYAGQVAAASCPHFPTSTSMHKGLKSSFQKERNNSWGFIWHLARGSTADGWEKSPGTRQAGPSPFTTATLWLEPAATVGRVAEFQQYRAMAAIHNARHH